jgi:hypothetical protein
MTTISAKTILRSRHAQRPDKILSTLLLRYPRPIHAEFMTHRVMSRNAASSRAIPVKKLIQDVRQDPFVPLHWGANQKGMQADQQLTGWTRWMVYLLWMAGMWIMTSIALLASRLGAHKQIVNRLIEPWAHITVVVSSTEWSNFLALRDHKDAEPHIQILAQEVRKELDRTDNIQTLIAGMWHLPFGTEKFQNQELNGEEYEAALQLEIKRSVACCASTSYKTVDGFDMTFEKAIELHDKLVGSAPLHASPAEHVAQADSELVGMVEGTGIECWENQREHGNFEGFRQYRKMLPNECL